MEKERETLKTKQEMPFLGGKQCFSIENKERKGTPKKTNKQKTDKKNKYELFSYQSNFSSFWVGVQNFPVFDNLAQKAHTLKHYKNRGFSKLSWKKHMCHETAIFGPKNQKSEIPVNVFFACFLLFQQQKTKNCWNPYFFSVVANLNKENFQI